MLRGLRMKLVMIMVLLILSLMTVVGAFLINSVMTYYLTDFYTQISQVFQDEELARDLTASVPDEEDGAQSIFRILEAYAGALGINRGNRNFYILDGDTGVYLAGTDDAGGPTLEYTQNLGRALTAREIGSQSSIAADYMDVAIPILRGESRYIIYILDDKTTVRGLTDEILILIIEALFFGLVISVLLSFLLSKTMVAPLQQLTDGARRVATGDFSRRIEVASRDEIGILTDTFNDMARQLEDTIRQVESERHKLATLFLHMTDGVVAFSRLGELIHANPAAEQMLRRKLGAGTSYEALFGDIAPLSTVLDEPDPLRAQRRIRERYLQLLLAPFDRQSPGGGVMVVIHDVTEQRRNEETHRQFVANVSHELRTPLTNIYSYAETLSDGTDIPPETRKRFFGVILSEIERMTSLVQDLLTLSRLDSGRADLKLERFAFADAVNDIFTAVYMDARRHNHTITLDMAQGVPSILADRARIVQVMMNVVSNSIKYTPEGGTIAITVGHRPGWVWMVVDDNGVGIPEEDRENIFQRFYRVDKARSRQSGGTGLGLSIAKELVDRHEGTLALEDKDTPGLAVRLELKVDGPDSEGGAHG